MTTQPTALWLADVLDRYYEDRGPADEKKAAAELRRLHEVSEHKGRLICDLDNQINSLERTKEELLEALEEVLAYCVEHGHDWMCMAQAKAVILKATGEQG